jgi:hypothetical protein
MAFYFTAYSGCRRALEPIALISCNCILRLPKVTSHVHLRIYPNSYTGGVDDQNFPQALRRKRVRRPRNIVRREPIGILVSGEGDIPIFHLIRKGDIIVGRCYMGVSACPSLRCRLKTPNTHSHSQGQIEMALLLHVTGCPH